MSWWVKISSQDSIAYTANLNKYYVLCKYYGTMASFVLNKSESE